jgi:hypothetical protein
MGGQHDLQAIRIENSCVAFNLKTGWLARGGRAGGFVPPTLPPWMRQEVGLWKRALPMCP